ncbi:hypothetical protein C0992_009810 [Termitomyces sp. T32_za158]|nr:hypothetical protein C0992_009810 [Termitomyces sp. T32_za158]
MNNADSTIDDLTLALANFSRGPAPEPDRILPCCCGKDHCEKAKAWSELKARLESRLILSAGVHCASLSVRRADFSTEVGQALLQRHEAYVRQHNGQETPPEPTGSASKDIDDEDILDRSAIEIAELLKEKAKLEKRLNQALVNNEVAEVSTNTIMQELHEARSTISRLTAQHARSVGWETQALYSAQLGQTALIEQNELTTVLESLVSNNETLKRDNAELQSLLTESREDMHVLQEELEELRARPRSMMLRGERIGSSNSSTLADALTLTNRLKRQHLKGADIGHLSRSTVNNIISEVTNLRTQFRFLFEDDNIAIPATRKDFRVLFNLFKEIFTAMGEIRVFLNDVIVDPSCATRVSEQALNPSLTDVQDKDRNSAGSSAAGWMAPISKLFSPPPRGQGERSGLNSSVLHRPPSTRPARVIPKLGPALSSSATTVNVEFSGAIVGRSTTSTVASQAKQRDEAPGSSVPVRSAAAVMDIFAGAPQHTSDPWVIVPPKDLRRVQSFAKPSSEFSGGTLRRSVNRSSSNALPRDVENGQGPDGEEVADDLAPLQHTTLRRRRLSDSSIHSTFASQADNHVPVPPVPFDITAWPGRQSVFQALRETVQSIRNTASLGTSGAGETPVATAPERQPQPPAVEVPRSRSSTSGPLHNLLPTWTSWSAQARNVLDPMTEASLLVGSVRDESYTPTRTRRPGEPHATDYF